MPDFPVYHTAFDSYDWMVNYGDPLFHRHVAITGVWGLVALHLADDAVLPLNYLSYVTQLQSAPEENERTRDKHREHKCLMKSVTMLIVRVYTNVLSNMLEDSVSLHPITASIQELATAAKEEEEEAKKLREQETLGNLLVLKKRTLNDRLMFAERGFLDAEGLKGRQWFKHLIYGPCRYHESKLVFFPGIVDAIAESRRMNKKEGQAAIQHEVWRVARAIQRAAFALRGELT
ncbi:glutamate carboxypeptidase II [Sarracenia purpurea var. burkii]